ncbi:endonuclease domain-containing 1 protein-like [Ctenopharyngodon idella]|uniref:endonuclease domain-containing 1 protein-like n=1 Tax=Ctenopharyngodon idella TaxID=7959 RepID=UPI00222F4801|nr:endonuclease domain-containing 1 protein-like [Ctenopharyngodon idella]
MILLLHVLMLFLLSGGSAKVVKNFELDCGEFFANGKSPTKLSGPQYKQICQTRNGVVHFATYYDTYNRIPVYSAYKFEEKKKCTRQNNWLIEPQLDDKAGPNMASEGSVKIRGEHQSLDEDYENSGYDRGHLAPVFQANSQDCAYATFTLTNAAPQNPSFNRGQWRILEKNMAEELSKQCLPKKYSVYIVTGVTPGKNKIKKDRVNVPSHFWTAYCCLDKDNRCHFSGGFIGKNEDKIPEEKTVYELETELAKLYNVRSFEVFKSSTELIEPKKRKIIKH